MVYKVSVYVRKVANGFTIGLGDNIFEISTRHLTAKDLTEVVEHIEAYLKGAFPECPTTAEIHIFYDCFNKMCPALVIKDLCIEMQRGKTCPCRGGPKYE